MKTIIDLSHVIQDNMPVHPYDGIVKEYAIEGFNSAMKFNWSKHVKI